MPKRFVFIFNENGFAICLKATSHTELYANRSEMLAGIVYCAANSLPFFPENTVIQPDNLHPITHAQIAKCCMNGTLEILGVMPEGFDMQIKAAVAASITIKPARKKSILDRL